MPGTRTHREVLGRACAPALEAVSSGRAGAGLARAWAQPLHSTLDATHLPFSLPPEGSVREGAHSRSPGTPVGDHAAEMQEVFALQTAGRPW